MWAHAVPSFSLTRERTCAMASTRGTTQSVLTEWYSRMSIKMSSEKHLSSQGSCSSCVHVSGGGKHPLLADWRKIRARLWRWSVGLEHLMCGGKMEGTRLRQPGEEMSQGKPNCRCPLSHSRLPTSSQQYTKISCLNMSCFVPCCKGQK